MDDVFRSGRTGLQLKEEIFELSIDVGGMGGFTAANTKSVDLVKRCQRVKVKVKVIISSDIPDLQRNQKDISPYPPTVKEIK